LHGIREIRVSFVLKFSINNPVGEVAEWLNAPVSKTTGNYLSH